MVSWRVSDMTRLPNNASPSDVEAPPPNDGPLRRESEDPEDPDDPDDPEDPEDLGDPEDLRGLEQEVGAMDVLVVDDEPANLQAVEAALDGLAVRITTAQRGHEALRAVLRHNVALILLDIRLPDLSGFEVAAAVRERAASRHIPIIFLTAHLQDEADVRRGYDLGAVDYLLKPFSAPVLRAKVQVFVELRRRNAMIQAQARRLRELQRAAARRELEQARRAWEAEALRRQMSEQARINAQLAAEDRRKDEFLAVLAHELRNPLAPIVAGLDLLRMGIDDRAQVDKICDAMTRQSRHVVRLVDDLLDVSRISQGKVALKRAQIDIRECIEHAVETCEQEASAQAQSLECHLPDRPLWADVDPDRIVQVASNLVGNAIRYTPREGHIVVEGLLDEDEVVIRVTDDGRGIAPDMLDRVFDRFVQARNEGTGLGLGLTLVKQVVELHGGRVCARSEGLDQGSVFEARLQRAASDETATSSGEVVSTPANGEPAEPIGGGERFRILLVEDDVDVALTTSTLLQEWGHEVVVARTGRDGVSQAQQIAPRLVLLDIGLPDMTGYDVAREIRSALGERTPRMVAVTGFGQQRDRERALEAGFDDHVTKPTTAETLRSALRDVSAT